MAYNKEGSNNNNQIFSELFFHPFPAIQENSYYILPNLDFKWKSLKFRKDFFNLGCAFVYLSSPLYVFCATTCNRFLESILSIFKKRVNQPYLYVQ